MEITLNIPDDVREEVQRGQNGGGVRHLLEYIGVELYKASVITGPQLRQMLDLERFELDGVLKSHNVFIDYSPEELSREEETSRMLFASQDK